MVDPHTSQAMSVEKNGVASHGEVGLASSEAARFSAQERTFLLGLARQAVASAAAGGPAPEVPTEGLASELLEIRACFVTLTKAGELRGCIGHVLPQEPLYLAVMDNAHAAAIRDPRFPPVRPDEVAQLKLEISVLTEPQALVFASPDELLEKLQPHRDGVFLRIEHQTATFLPQVWAQVSDKTEFMDCLARKAGCPPSAWREPGAQAFTYRVEAFAETN